MQLTCGPNYDLRQFTLELPKYPSLSPRVEKSYLRNLGLRKNYNIGVLVSGGIDSAVLYYLLLDQHTKQGSKFSITPYTILRKEGSKFYAKGVINHIHNIFNLPNIELNVVGDPEQPELAQVNTGVRDILEHNDFVYLGIIESKPEHSLNWIRPTFTETDRIRYPFLKLQKSHVIDILYKYNLEVLLELTHSCAVDERTPCGHCNGCREREWGISQLGR